MEELLLNLNAYGILIFICWLVIVLLLSYKLALGKTLKIKKAIVIGGITAIIPPLAIIYLLSLYFRKNIKPYSNGSANESS